MEDYKQMEEFLGIPLHLCMQMLADQRDYLYYEIVLLEKSGIILPQKKQLIVRRLSSIINNYYTPSFINKKDE